MKQLITLLLISLALHLHAQTPAYVQYTHKEGLPSNVCYQFFQNARGYMWIGTNDGAARFDGLHFRNYTISRGLHSNEVICVDELSDSALIIGTYTSGINNIKNNVVTDSIFNFKPGKINSFLKNKNTIYIPGEKGTYIFENKTTKGKAKLIKHDKNLNILSKYYMTTSDSVYYTLHNGQIMTITDSGLALNSLSKVLPNAITAMDAKFNKIYLAAQSTIYICKKTGIEEKIQLPIPQPSTINKIVADKKGNIWLVINDTSLYIYQNKNLINISTTLPLEQAHINDILVDREDNLWLSTNGKGVFYLYNYYITNFPQFKDLSSVVINQIASHDGDIGISTSEGFGVLSNGNLQYFRDGEFHYQAIFKNKWLKAVNKITTANNNDQFIASAIADAKDYLLIGKGHTLYFNSNNKVVDSVVLPSSAQRVNCITTAKNGVVFIGTKNGFYRYNVNTKTLDSFLTKSAIHKITNDSISREIWIAADNGLWQINASNKLIKHGKIGKIELGKCTDIILVETQKYVSCDAGLVCFKVPDEIISQYNQASGIKGDQINAIAYDKKFNEIWMGTNDGISMISLNLIPPIQITATPRIEELITDDSTYIFPNFLELPYQNKKIQLVFSTPSFNETKNIIYRYKIDDQKNYTEGIERSVTLSSLANGTHTIYLQARNPDGLWSAEANYTFAIATPWYKSLLFRIGIGLLTLGLAWFIYYKIKQRSNAQIKEANRQKQRAQQWKQNALLLQLHHHLQEEAMENTKALMATNPENAQTYFTIFSNFNEEALQHSKELFNTLEDELKLTAYYLQVEQVRLPDTITYNIIVDEEIIPQQIQIPTLLLIPFVQNAIWHGLQYNKGKKGHINIAFQKGADDKLIISISDDGVGPKTSAFFKKQHRVELDIKGTEQRLLNIHSSLKDAITINDLSDLNEDDKGTLIVITLNDEAAKKS